MIFEEREKFMFKLLEEAEKKAEFVIIGGYAINAYTLPRFSVDCDVVVKDKNEARKLYAFLESKGFKKRAEGKVRTYKGEFTTLAIKKPVAATFDIMVGAIEDRLSGTVFPAELIFKHSSKRTIFGKGSPFSLEALVVDSEMLFLMKAISCRKPDVRDVFMLASTKLDKQELSEISSKIPIPKDNVEKIVSTVNSEGFKNALQGVYGKLPQEQFERTRKRLSSLLEK